jgi:PAS domain S-box-containing protein
MVLKMIFKKKSGGKISLWIPITVTAIIGTLLSFSLFFQLKNMSRKELLQKFNNSADERANLIISNLDNYLHDLEAVQRFFDGSSKVSRKEFKTFVTPIIKDRGFQAVEWLPRVRLADRELFEKRARAEGFKDFKFTELNSGRKLVTAEKRDEYFPVYYIEPLKGNENAFGYAPPPTNPARGKSLLTACDSNKPMASERVTLVQEKENYFALLVVLPVYKGGSYIPNTVELRRQYLDGYIQGVLRPVDIMNKIIRQISQAEIEIKLIDISAGDDKSLLYSFYSAEKYNSLKFDSALTYSRVFTYCGRDYKIECLAGQNFVKINTDETYLTIPVICALFTLFIVLYLSTLIYHQRKMEALVEKRTKELKESEQRFRALIQNSNDIFGIIGLEGVVKFISPSVERITGFTPEEMINRSIFDLIYEEDVENIRNSLNEIKSTQSVLFTNQFRHYKKQGGFCYIETISQNLCDLPGIDGIVINVRDITERKAVEEELINAKLKAEEMNRVKSSFFANMSHELRTPLHGILGISQILNESVANEKLKSLIEMLTQSGKRLLNTLNMILNLTKVEANKLDIKYSKVNITRLIKNCIRIYETAYKQKNLELGFECGPAELIAETDEQMLTSVVNNMIDNAIKYTNEGSVKVTLDFERRDGTGWMIVRVRDTGIGISAEEQGMIFDEFRQVSEGYNRSFEGAGLGLTITKKYVELLHGKITVESQPGKGSVFSVLLPVSAAEDSV